MRDRRTKTPRKGRSRIERAAVLLFALGVPSGVALAQTSSGPPAKVATTLPTIEVIAVSPVLGSGIDPDKVPANLRVLTDRDIRGEGVPDLPGALQRRVSSVTLTDVEGSPFQPNIQFRGFNASPVVGTPQGLAVYQNGVRINEAFGDTVNWDLIPEVAIDRLNLVTGNPVFGLNALGGALAIEMKNGFKFQGFEAEAHGGSFGRRAGSLQYGVEAGNLASYIAADGLNESGWRDRSPSELRRLYADLGARGERGKVHVNFTGVDNRFGAIAATPIELLEQNRSAVYTFPQRFRNQLATVALNGDYKVTDTLSFQGNFYYRGFRQQGIDGNTAEIDTCNRNVARRTLCLEDDTTILFDTGGNPIPSGAIAGGVPGSVDRTRISSDGIGGALQLTSTGPLFGRPNHLVAGASYDRGVSDFSASSELGSVGPDLLVAGTGITIGPLTPDLGSTSVRTTNNYYGLYATDTFDVTEALAVTASGRFNYAEIRLNDRIGTALNGDNRYSRFNPALGATYKLGQALTAYAGYSEANRAPTPSELGCADPARPCLLANFVVSDPPLKQVVAHTYETGLRGGFRLGGAEEGGGKIDWNIGLFRTDLADDIINVASSFPGRAFFQNAGDTRRQGIEAGLTYSSQRWLVQAGYSLVDATFESALTLLSPNNPVAASGVINVRPGDHLPLLPQHRFKLGAEYKPAPAWVLGADLVVVSDQYLRGDEANQNSKIPAYFVVNLHASYDITENVRLFALAQNLFDKRYETFGTFFEPGQIPFLGLRDPRTLTPAPPLGVFAGLRVKF
jgi:iron complex outermembrane recepter protein